MRDLFVALLGVHNTQRALTVTDECAAPVALEGRKVVGVGAA